MNSATGLNEKLMIYGLRQIFANIQNIFWKFPAILMWKIVWRKKQKNVQEVTEI